ncbi:hypothetical protein KR222_001211, partial [Zaprionus bogoriensis]
FINLNTVIIKLCTPRTGIGKTTLIRKICERISGHCRLQGFHTDEVRSNGQRIGFDVVSVAGARGILAREQPPDSVRRPKVGKYSVYVQDFEQLALPLLQTQAAATSPPTPPTLYVVDEVGKMEVLSESFAAAMEALLQQQLPLLASIPSQTRRPLALVERLKGARNARVFHVSSANRVALVDDVTAAIVSTLH